MTVRNVGSPSRRSSVFRAGLGCAVTAFVAASTLGGCAARTNDSVIRVYVGADQAPAVKKVAERCSTPEYQVRGYGLPTSADDARLQIARRITGNDRSLNIMGLDNTWTAEFASAGWSLPVPSEIAARQDGRILSGPLQSARYRGVLYGVPAWTNTQLLWYRKDSLANLSGAPSVEDLTWQDMLALAEKSGDVGGPTQIGVTAAQYEGLTVWFNSLLAGAGGRVVDESGTRVVLGEAPNRGAGVQALSLMKQVLSAPGRAPGLTQYEEPEARLGMERGSALFEINWPFVFASMRENSVAGAVPFLEQDMAPFRGAGEKTAGPGQLAEMNRMIRQKFDFAPFPRSDPARQARPTLGGSNFHVSKTTARPDLAWKAVECLTTDAAARTYAFEAGAPPAVEAIYDEPEFADAYPMGGVIRKQLREEASSLRPVTPVYQAMSTLLQAEFQLGRDWSPETKIDQLVDAAEKAMGGEGLVP
ncbi:extracellular solute-binding protein [Tsukamurella tyrosinosolvens]|uniref:extracellular solute-binding protein n=1 Tax=Tsukamurella tyrosinosolvens TaxID=57704 RepID=UPI000DF6E5D6|nr:extracellular solute-binding protein [Tsukamurella tyrosinosolvens]RDB47295.1 extracellular solute-binding protein [Tsukamurella tyrosinosolvens]